MVQFIVIVVAIARDLRQADGERRHNKDSSDSQNRDNSKGFFRQADSESREIRDGNKTNFCAEEIER
jgi:hypothetical protein